MVKAHPYRAVSTVLAVMLVLGGTAALIGQDNDGPWGGLPEWLGAVTWFGFLAASLAMLVLSAYLGAANLAWRREHSPQV